MNYQITCPCGNSFTVSESQLGKHIACPVCNRALLAVAPQPSTPAQTTDASLHPEQKAVKQCPFCGETILAVARKCRYCNEFLDRPASPLAPSYPPTPSSASNSPSAATLPASPAIFELSVSQWDNFFRYLICILIVIGVGYLLFGIPAIREMTKSWAALAFIIVVFLTGFSAYLIYLATHNSRCTIRPDRIETQSGIFSKQNDQIDLIRVIDLELRQNLLERILGIGTLMIKSSDPTSPTLELYQIPHARKVYKYLQDQIPNADRARGALRVES